MEETKTLSRTYTADGEEITLTPNGVAKYILGGNVDNVPEAEYAKVIATCAARGLNPFTGDVAIQPHWNKRLGANELSIVPTKDFFQRRAESHPNYAGKSYGIIIMSADGRPVKRPGTCVYAALGEVLIGGWCEVRVKGREVPEYAEVSLSEYSTGKSLWQSKPATMIAKVAKSQALREAFPSMFNGLYEPEELGLPTNEQGEIVDEVADERIEYEPNSGEIEVIETGRF